MTAAINGKTLSSKPAPDPRPAVAAMVFAALSEEGETWAALDDEERAEFVNIADHYLSAHGAWLTANGFRLVPPGATPRPHTEQEALAMIQAAKDFFDGQKRKGKLMGAAVPKKMILPPGAH